MDLLQQHRTSLLTNFSKELSEVDGQIQLQLSRREQDADQDRRKLHAELAQCRVDAARLEALELENARLRQKLEAPQTRSRTTVSEEACQPPQESAPSPTESASFKGPRATKDAYGTLVAKYNRLKSSYQVAKEAHNTLVVKYRAERENYRKWMAYAEQQLLASKEDLLRSDGAIALASVRDPTPNPNGEDHTAVGRLRPLKSALVTSDDGRLNESAGPGKKVDRHSSARRDINCIPTPGSSRLSMLPSEDDNESPALPDATLPPLSAFASFRDRRSFSHRRLCPGSVANAAGGVLQSPKPSSSESTQEETHTPINGFSREGTSAEASRIGASSREPEAEADVPIVVSARALKRKRNRPAASGVSDIAQPRRGSMQDPVKVKSEIGSSSPLGGYGYQEPGAESLDLDEVGRVVRTPRKRVRLQSIHATEGQSVDGESLPLRGFDQERGPMGEDGADEARAMGEDAESCLPSVRDVIDTAGRSAGTSGSTTERRTRQSHARAGPSNPAASPSPPLNETGTRDRPTTVLQSLSTNAKLLRPHLEKMREHLRSPTAQGEEDMTGSTPDNGKTDSPGRVVAAKQSLSSTKDRPPKAAASSTGKPDARRRLTSLLGVASPHPTPLAPASAGTVGAHRRKSTIPSSETPGPRRTEGSASRNEQLWTPTASKGKPSSKPSHKPSHPAPPPLRTKPLPALSLEDFKVNPAYNQGYDYAFTETVRTHDRRRCLPGCTRPDCCGDALRKSIQIGGLPAPAMRTPRWNSSPPENEEAQLLQRYVGDDDVDDDDDAIEKEELLLRARTKWLADTHGKHRQAYERRRTPPGFWRTDMPTTQELQADRDEAKKADRAKVEERYREAMRPGGRWIFRDEQERT
ncbi:MAG: hypothetical protein M1826_002657 [Phylliscum demangeonii]|nr:MAG: hypothetical protein M1826_002657 [Phylliscum demangeonii]